MLELVYKFFMETDKLKIRVAIALFLLSVLVSGVSNISSLFVEIKGIPLVGVFINKSFILVYLFFTSTILAIKAISFSINQNNMKIELQRLEQFYNSNIENLCLDQTENTNEDLEVVQKYINNLFTDLSEYYEVLSKDFIVTTKLVICLLLIMIFFIILFPSDVNYIHIIIYIAFITFSVYIRFSNNNTISSKFTDLLIDFSNKANILLEQVKTVTKESSKI